MPVTGLETAARMASVAGPGSSSGRGTAAAAGRFPAGRGGSGAAGGGGVAADDGFAVGAGAASSSGMRSIISNMPRAAWPIRLRSADIFCWPAAAASSSSISL